MSDPTVLFALTVIQRIELTVGMMLVASSSRLLSHYQHGFWGLETLCVARSGCLARCNDDETNTAAGKLNVGNATQ